ncbi:MAG: hypothetical protein H0W83_04575 [Planctomycetes bacterium]|nr:hypothetical protein [Planctomycetota bacterium]
MSKTQTQPRSGNDLQHSGLFGYRIVPKPASRTNVVLEAGVASIETGAAQSAALSDAWNTRMDDLGARRGTWDELQALLPG